MLLDRDMEHLAGTGAVDVASGFKDFLAPRLPCIPSKIAAEYNLTFSQFMVLEALYSKGDMSVGEVRERILSSVGTIPLIVNNLVKMNYVERMCNEKDRRVCILHLTQEGYDVISKIVPRNEAMIAESMEVLDQEEKEKLLYLLKKIGGKL